MATPITTIMDLREPHRRRGPPALFEYAVHGSYETITLRDNRAAFDEIRLRQRVTIDVEKRSLATTNVGQPG